MIPSSHDLPPRSKPLSVFPLTGVLLLPGGRLPLHIFEPRYRNLIRDALAGDAIIGMVQPIEPAADNQGPGDQDEPTSPALYDVGCTGLLEQWEELADGRYVVLLKGLRRFRATAELAMQHGYRRLAVRYDSFGDPEKPPENVGESVEDDRPGDVAKEALLVRIGEIAARLSSKIDLEQLGGLAPSALVDVLAMYLPFSPAEKQALLEAPTPRDRHEVLESLLDMGFPTAGPDRGAAGPTLH